MLSSKNERQAQSINEQTIMAKGATMTSREIAKVAGKNHKDVLESIRNMEPAWEKVTGRKFPLSEYKDSSGRKVPMYELTQRECLYIATKFNNEARAKLIVRWEELEIKNLSQSKQLTEDASPYQEETLISVPLGRIMVHIWVKNRVIYAPLARIMQYCGYNYGLSPQQRERFGRENFIMVDISEKQSRLFVSLAGFVEIAKWHEVGKEAYRNILTMYGALEPAPPPRWAYCFTESGMLELMEVINRRPINKPNLIELLLNGKLEGGANE